MRGLAQGKPMFYGRACPYDSWSNLLSPSKGDRTSSGKPFRERFMPGVFDSALATADVICTWNHDVRCLLGRTGAGTLRLRNETDGLYVECDRIDTTYANDLQKLIDRGDVTGMSFQFQTVADVYVPGATHDDVTVKQAHIRETSFVTRPAYPMSAAGVRDDEDLQPASPVYKVDGNHLELLRLLAEM